MNNVALLLSLFIFGFVELVHSVEEDIEVILLPLEWGSGNITVPLSFMAFGKKVDLMLEKNENLLTPNFEVWKREGENDLIKVDNFVKRSSCHYLHKDSFSSAAVSLCNSGAVDDSLEITPLSNEDSEIFENHRIQVRSASSYGEPHIIKRRRIPSYRESYLFDTGRSQISPRHHHRVSKDEIDNEINTKEAPILTVELALFLDEAAYRLFMPHFSNDESKLLDLMLAYVNNIQALYYHPSLGQRIDLALVRLELMKRQPQKLAHLDGERGETLEAFCAYAKSINPKDDKDPRHWDMGLYVSGLDFYAVEKGKQEFITMGLAPVGGVCWDTYACVITEFGPTNTFGKPYPSTGFTSLYVAAHEIGHNLGMSHDSSGNKCPKDGYIMSPSRGPQGEAQWSSCSRDVALNLAKTKRCLLDRPGLEYRREGYRHLDHRGKYGQLPGRRWTAKRQCEIMLKDVDAVVDTLKDVCRALKCSTPRKMGFYLAGPALDGTKCGEGSECRAGECLQIEDVWDPQPTNPITQPPTPSSGWGEWREGSCQSGCIRGSIGFLERRRSCSSDQPCQGLGFDVFLCKDNELCERAGRKRLSAVEFASQRCLEFASKLDEIDGTAGGLQAEHEEARLWMGCAIFCKRKDIASYYTPRMELNDLGIDPYFPDGTWCHKEGEENYYCRRHHCLSENFRFGKGLSESQENELLGPMNAWPDGRPRSAEVVRYLSLGMDGRPLMTKLPEAGDGGSSDEDPWLDPKDYVELPELQPLTDELDKLFM